MARSYFGSHLTDNIIQKPDGSIVCLDVVIARTGFQDYKVSELPQDRATDLGIDTSNGNATIRLYRSPEEVFHPETIASFEGAPVTDNHPPNMEFVSPQNFSELAKGHAQNVRKGKQILDSGEWPMIADLVISAEPLITDILENRKREISCGYDYSIDRDGDTVLQTSMVGNHTAVVPKGRAGPEARITDAAAVEDVAEEAVTEVVVTDVATVEEQVAAEPAPLTQPVTEEAVTQPITPTDPPQEKKPMKLSLKSIFGHGLRVVAQDKDVDPDSLADAAQELSILTTPGSNGNGNNGNRAKANDEGAHIDIPPEPVIVQKVGDRRSDDRGRGDDRRTDDRHRADDKRRADDRRRSDDRHRADDDNEPDEERDRAHAALDRMLDARAKRSEDADIAELRKLMDNYFQEEQHEPEHAAMSSEDDDPDMIPEGNEADDAYDDDDEDQEEAEEVREEEGEPGVVGVGDRHADDVEGFSDESGFHPIRGSEGYKRGKAGDPRKKRARDSAGDNNKRARAADAAAAAARQALVALKPLIAKSNDSALIRGYNAQLRRVSGGSFSRSTDGYGRFAGASRARATDTGTGEDEVTKLQAFYNNSHGKKITAEVK